MHHKTILTKMLIDTEMILLKGLNLFLYRRSREPHQCINDNLHMRECGTRQSLMGMARRGHRKQPQHSRLTTDLENLAFTASGHTGTALRLFGTNASGAATEFATSSLILTSDLIENSNLFYTDARVAAYISASTTICKGAPTNGNILLGNGTNWTGGNNISGFDAPTHRSLLLEKTTSPSRVNQITANAR